ncbi:MAG: hypothetical protein HY321_14240 [Armatimonadetes bacterium]|nr:hypothetical protein [Armatimonadota bacterium]
MFQKTLFILAGSLLLSRLPVCTAAQPGLPRDYWGTALDVPAVDYEKVFRPSQRQANFTAFAGVDEVRVEKGVLTFRLTGSTATLGWGNYQGKQPAREVADLWEEADNVRLRVRQTGGESKWTLLYWVDGERMDKPAGGRPARAVVAPAVASLAGGEWHDLEFQAGVPLVPTPDGLEVQIEGTPGTRFEIQSVGVVQPRHAGYLRKEFVLPQGSVWRAIADVGGPPDITWFNTRVRTTLTINGKEVKRDGPTFLYHTSPVDIAPYLRPGRNCLALSGYRVGRYTPFVFFQARIVMASGQSVDWQTDTSWKYSPTDKEGWRTVGFDDSGWGTPEESTLAISHTEDGRVSSYINTRANDSTLSIPAYKGRLVLRHPGRRSLFYQAGQPVQLVALAPPGLRSSATGLRYVLSKADSSGRLSPVREGSVSQPSVTSPSLLYRINLGGLPRGVYAIALTLKGRAGAIEERAPEPLMVLARFSPKETRGKDYFEGLDVELEDSIDFTDPNDPHPWIEARPGRAREPATAITTPTVIRKEGLAYRETSTERGAFFSYRFQFQHPGDFYVMECEYPDDAERELEISISSKVNGAWSNSQSGVGAETGGHLYLTGRVQPLRWIHVADPGVHSVDVINVWSGLKAAAKSLRIYHVRGGLPSAGSGDQRLYGMHSERCFFTSGIGMNFGTRQPLTNEQEAAEQQLPVMTRFFKDLVWMQDTAERYAQYLKFAGQNTHIIGCYQYNESNTPFVHASPTDTARLPYCLRSVLAHALDVNGINFYAGVEWSQSTNLSTLANNAQVARGVDTIWMLDDQGRQYYGNVWSTVVPNWLHPKNQASVQELVRQLARKFGDLKRFKGVHNIIAPAQGVGYWPPAFAINNAYDRPLALSYDDVTFAEFGKAARVPLPAANDPDRFRKRAQLLEDPAARSAFLAWRAQAFVAFVEGQQRALTGSRSDLQLMNALWVEESDFFKYWTTTGRPFKEYLKDYALDLDRLKGIRNSWLGRWTISWRQSYPVFPSRDPYCWIPRVDPDVTSAFDRPTNRYVFVRSSWDENISPSGGSFSAEYVNPREEPPRLAEGSDWVMNYNRVRALPQPGGFHAREALAQALITADPNALTFGMTDLNLCVGNEGILRDFARVVTHLPKERFQPVLNTGLSTNLAIRQLAQGGQSYLYVVNPGYWQATGSIVLQTDGVVYDLVTGGEVALRQQEGKNVLSISLEPFGVAAYRVASPRLTVESYRIAPIGEQERAHIERIAQSAADLLPTAGTSAGISDDDRRFLTESLAQAKQALADGEYARAWSTLTHWRFWTLRQALQKGGAGRR